LRQQTLERVVFRGEAAHWRDAKSKVEWLDTIAGGPGYRIKKLRFEALPGMWIPALLYEPENLSGQVSPRMKCGEFVTKERRNLPCPRISCG